MINSQARVAKKNSVLCPWMLGMDLWSRDTNSSQTVRVDLLFWVLLLSQTRRLSGSWSTLCGSWSTLCGSWSTMCGSWSTVWSTSCGSWSTLCGSWSTYFRSHCGPVRFRRFSGRCEWSTLCGSWFTMCGSWSTMCGSWSTFVWFLIYLVGPSGPPGRSRTMRSRSRTTRGRSRTTRGRSRATRGRSRATRGSWYCLLVVIVVLDLVC